MTAKQYVNAITKKIRCSSKKKKEIQKQLFAEINEQLEQGIDLKEIMAQMGTATEISDSFNENISEGEQKKFKRGRMATIFLIAILIVAAFMTFVYWILPKARDIEKSQYFNKNQVEEVIVNTIEAMELSDYETLQSNAISGMQAAITQESLDAAKGNIAENWGARKQIGKMYLNEVSKVNIIS